MRYEAEGVVQGNTDDTAKMNEMKWYKKELMRKEEEEKTVIAGKEWLPQTHKVMGILPEVYDRWNDPKSSYKKKFARN